MATIGVKVELEGQKEYTQGMKQLKEQTKLFDTQLKNLDQTMKGQSAFSKAMKEHDLLTQKMEALNKESELLQNRIKQASETYGENDSRTLALKNQYEKLQVEIAKTGDALQKNNGFFTAFSAELDSIGGKLDNVGSKMTAAGESLTKNLTAPLVGLGAASVAAFNEVDSGLDTIIKKTGASGESLEEMKKISENLATSIPTDFDTVGEAIGEVNTRFGSTGKDLENLSEKFIKFSELNGTDVSNSIDVAQKALAAYGLGAESAADYLDRLNLVGQQTGVSVDSISNGIISNATAFQELGLSIDEAVTFMGQLEKSGTNSETVLNGMRKALKNAAAEGKPLDQALEELQDTIVNGKDGMDGLTAAYELFGKSGDQIYGAVKNGTVDFKKLAGTLEDAGGSIEDTFEATIDPIDKFQTSMNKLKISGSKLVNSAAPMIDKFFDKTTKAIDKLTSKWDSLSKEEQEQIIEIAGIVAAAGPLLMVLGKIVSTVGSLFTSVSSLITFVVANPILAGAAVALGLVAAAMIYCKTQSDALYHSIADLSDANQQATDAAKQYNEQIGQMISDNKDAVAAIDLQYDSEKKLLEELKGIVDENGNVKSGYEDRARVITDELAEAFGIEIEYQDGVIKKYDEVMKKIDEVIQKKKAEALLSANQDDYINALNTQKEAYEGLKNAQDEAAAAQAGYDEALQKYIDAQNSYDEAMKLGVTNLIPYSQKLAEAGEELEAWKDAVSNTTEAVQEQEQAFYNSQAVINNYEELQKALEDGTISLDSAITQMTNNLMNDAPISYLKTQAEDAKTYYEQILADYESGEVAISEEQLAAAKANSEEAQRILAEAVEEYRHQGEEAANGYASGMEDRISAVNQAASAVAASALKALAEAQETGSPAKKYIEQGEYAGQGYIDGLESKQQSIAATILALDTLLSDSQTAENEIIANGILTNQETINGGLEAIYDSVDTKLDEVSETISSTLDGITNTFSDLTNNAYSWGVDFIGNFENGIVSKMQSVLSRVQSLASQISSYMHFSTPDRGPLASADEWMPDFMKLLAEGIDSNKYLVDNAMKGLSYDMADAIVNPIDPDELYGAVRRGASDATTQIYLNGRDLTRGLKDLGVQFNG